MLLETQTQNKELNSARLQFFKSFEDFITYGLYSDWESIAQATEASFENAEDLFYGVGSEAEKFLAVFEAGTRMINSTSNMSVVRYQLLELQDLTEDFGSTFANLELQKGWG